MLSKISGTTCKKEFLPFVGLEFRGEMKEWGSGVRNWFWFIFKGIIWMGARVGGVGVETLDLRVRGAVVGMGGLPSARRN